MLPLRVAKFMVAGRVDPSSTLAEFAASVGGREVSRTLAEAMVAGVYAGSAEEICVGAAFPRLLSRFGPKAERKHLGARGELTSFTRGMGTWTRAMADFVKGFFAESAGDFNAPGTLHVVTVPAFELCHMELLAGETELARLSEQVVYAPVISINMFARKKDFHHLPNGFGVLIPPGEPYRALGVLFNHDIFENRAQPEQVSLNFMYGGRRDPELTQLSDAELRELVQEEARRLFSFDGRALEIDVLRIPRAIPQYTRKLGEMWGHAHHYLETRNQENPAPVVLFGNYTGQVALRGMADGALGLVQKILSTSQSPSYS
jgi:protoporphyrinogen oxidase